MASLKLKIDPVKLFDEKQCEYCTNTGADFVTECKHIFHLNCFGYWYFYDQSCPKCNTKLLVEGLKVNNNKQCYTCKSEYNLFPCKTCKITTCFVCLKSKTFNECCSSSTNMFNTLLVDCPGCEYSRFYNDFVPIWCKGHSLLCKQCWNISIYSKKCIMGCNVNFASGIIKKCMCCDEIALENFGIFVCPRKCTVCFICYSTYFLKHNNDEISGSCPYCGEKLTPKYEPWD
ncbi:hypothetical protein SteCoe_2785 [Stentor coeruleus]|uniref:RING-type domain-containing protein n=1 Tax=Stentor coeruleus TaxID=5963 RepID=A0A1R2CYQ9_9CILI|nr:hypothetical protein SteCoe_2785 [Stentor coeruleus]